MGANIEFNEIVMSLMSHSFDAHRLHDKASRGDDVEDSPCCNADAIQIKGLVLSHGELEDDDGLSPMTGRHCTRRVLLPALLQLPAQPCCADRKTFRL